MKLLKKKKANLKSELNSMQTKLAIVVCGISAILFIVGDVITRTKGLERTLESSVSVLSRALSAPLMFQDKKEMAHVLESLEGHPVIAKIAIIDTDGNLLTSYPPEFQSRAKEEGGAFGNFPIHFKGEKLAIMRVWIRGELSRIDYGVYVLVLFLVTLFGYLAAYVATQLLSKEIVGQISGLLAVIQKTSNSNNYSHRVFSEKYSAPTIEEFDVLAREFDRMLAMVDGSIGLVAQANENLEKVVEQRTKELKEAQAMMLHTSKLSALGEMSAGVAHEINNPLGIISGTIPLLSKFRADAEKFESKTVLMEKAVARIDKIVKGLKKFSRTSQKTPHKVESVNVIIEDARIITEAKSKHNSTPIEFEIDANAKIFCDSLEIEQVVINLINNGIDAVKKSESRWIKVQCFCTEKSVVLRVIDSGDGISKEIEQKMFQPFFTTKPVGEGTGLGLSITRGILETHGASLRINREFQNTCFEIAFPLPAPTA